MTRNVGIQHLRGLQANLPTLLVGEVYLCTDTNNLFVGTASGNIPFSDIQYNIAGSTFIILANPHTVFGNAVIGSGGNVVISLTTATEFTTTTSYAVTVNYIVASQTTVLYVVKNNRTQFTIYGKANANVNFIAVGS